MPRQGARRRIHHLPLEGDAMGSQHLVIAAVFTAAACSVGAQTLKPGLWEIQQKMQTSSGDMEKNMSQMREQMANMSPEQRKMMEDMMARQGVRMGTGSGGGMNVKVCMTKEMVEKNEVPAQRGDCKTTQQSRTGNTMKMAFVCTKPPSSGEGQVTFTSPESYTMKMVVNSQADGKTEKVNMDGTGKWLGADCGNIKPMATPAR
jgi:hypothetical protein